MYIRVCIYLCVHVSERVYMCVFIRARRLKFSPRRQNATCILLAALFVENESMEDPPSTGNAENQAGALMHKSDIAAEKGERPKKETRNDCRSRFETAAGTVTGEI